LVAALACCIAVVGFAGVASGFHSYVTYVNNETLDPDEGGGTVYDTACDWWNENYMQKSVSGRYGTLAWINTGGGWPVSQKTTEQTMHYGIGNHEWTKKLHCVNSSVVTYNATCRGHGDLGGPGCV
jgi:hypothetical protein